MSYLVLARKYRPRSFAQIVGQDHVVRALTHALKEQRLHHAWLFTGTRGVGKTTISRLMAKALNCIGPDGTGGIAAEPCGVCDHCLAIDAGRFVDYVEMDAASNRSVDEMTELLERAVYAPSVGRFKVFMLDEVHMLTGHAFNAMLKTLEEPPPHLKFILATTDPHKVPVTVLSRCLQFNLKQMPPARIVEHLGSVLTDEGVPAEPNALRLIAQAARGSMRDALSLADQAIAYAAGPIDEASVRSMLGAVDTGWLIRLCDALVANDGASLVALVETMAEASTDFATALTDLAVLLQRIAMAQVVPESLPDDLPERDDIRRLAAAFGPEEVQLHYQIAVMGRSELALSPDEQAGFTMTLLRMLAFRPGEAAAPASGQRPARAPVSALRDSAATTRASATLLAPRSASVSKPVSREAPAATTQAEPGPATQPVAPFADDWPTFAASLDLRGLAREVVRQSELAGTEGATWRLRVGTRALLDSNQGDKIAAAITAARGHRCKVVLELGAAGDTAASRDSAANAERQRAAEQGFNGDPLVRELIDRHGASVVSGSVRPIDPTPEHRPEDSR